LTFIQFLFKYSLAGKLPLHYVEDSSPLNSPFTPVRTALPGEKEGCWWFKVFLKLLRTYVIFSSKQLRQAQEGKL